VAGRRPSLGDVPRQPATCPGQRATCPRQPATCPDNLSPAWCRLTMLIEDHTHQLSVGFEGKQRTYRNRGYASQFRWVVGRQHSLGDLPRQPATCPRQPVHNLSPAWCRQTMLVVDHTHKLCVGFQGKQRIWTSCEYTNQVRWVVGRRPSLGDVPRQPATCPRQPVHNLSPACYRLTMLVVDHTHQLSVGFEGKQRIWTSCEYTNQVRWVVGRRPSLGDLPRQPATCPRQPVHNLSPACYRLTMLVVDHTHQLCVGFQGKQRIWTSCEYTSQVRWVVGRRPSLGDVPRQPATCPR
jgi:hypothetical protein